MMNKSDFLVSEGDKLEKDLKGSMRELSFMLAALDFEFEDGEMQYDPTILFAADKTVDDWTDDYLIPIIFGLNETVRTLNKMLEDDYEGEIDEDTMHSVGFAMERGSYLSGVTDMGSVKMDVKKYLAAAMAMGYSRKQLMEGLKDVVETSTDKYFRTYLYDVISQYERMASRAVANKLGLKHFEYSGDIIKDTRDFCIERAGNVYSVEEAKTWNDLWWRGKIEGVDVMVALGGYNCRHSVLYLTKEEYESRNNE